MLRARGGSHAAATWMNFAAFLSRNGGKRTEGAAVLLLRSLWAASADVLFLAAAAYARGKQEGRSSFCFLRLRYVPPPLPPSRALPLIN